METSESTRGPGSPRSTCKSPCSRVARSLQETRGARIASVECQSFLLLRAYRWVRTASRAVSRAEAQEDGLRGSRDGRTLRAGRGSRFPEERSFRLRSPSRGGALLASRRRLCAPRPTLPPGRRAMRKRQQRAMHGRLDHNRIPTRRRHPTRGLLPAHPGAGDPTVPATKHPLLA